MKITEEQRKLLTEWLEECWHEISCINGERMCSCGVVGNLNIILAHKGNRTFTTWEDFGAVVERLQPLGVQMVILCAAGENKFSASKKHTVSDGVEALTNPERFCILVAEAINEGVIK